jgi:hypothetical protein
MALSQYPTHYSPAGNGDGLDIFIHQNITVSDVIVSDILDSDHVPMDQGHQLPFMVLQDLNFNHPRKPTQLLTA